MNVWCHLPTIISRRHFLRFAVILALCVAFITMLFVSVSHTFAAPGINKTISFQGRLLDKNSSPVPDGYYNVEFKIYEGGDGKTIGNTGGTLKWTEDHINNNGTGGVLVKGGYLSVDLGSKVAFGGSIDWNNDTLWLSMNIAGSSPTCTEFGGDSCPADGEMVPMKRLTATPYAINSGMLNGKTSDDFIHNSTDQQAGHFNISGSGTADTLQGIRSVTTPSLDTAGATTLSIGGTNATAISIGGADHAQSISIGADSSDTTLAIGSTAGSSQLTLNAGTDGVNVNSAGGFTVHTDATDRDTIAVAGDGNTSINLSTATSLSVNNDQDDTILEVANDGTISTGADSALAVQGSASFAQGLSISDDDANTASLLTLDQSSAAPIATDDSLLGSMYYDTTLGKVQCYEADGWGACSSSPDTFVALSPEFSNTVTNGTGIGDLTSDFCSDSLDINNGTNLQSTVCGENETHNFYDWTSGELTAQEKSLYVTYQLPTNFKSFVENSVSLEGMATGTDASVHYQLYQNTKDGLVACGEEMTVSDGTEPGWQTGEAKDDNDPAGCDFAAGDSIVFKITVTAQNNAHAYVSNLNFAFSNK